MYGLVLDRWQVTRFQAKAESAVRGWRKVYGSNPSLHAIVMVCAVAEGETTCGDAWNHSGNWGAVQRRTMTPAEKALASQNNPVPAKDPFEELHGDSSPIHGKYQAWFWKFPQGIIFDPAGLAGDDAGAWMLIRVLCEQAGRATAIKPFLDSMSAGALADAMYRTRYYEGFHVPAGRYDPPAWYHGSCDGDGKVLGAALNVATYAQGISAHQSRFVAGLIGWDPAQTPDLTEAELTALQKLSDETLSQSIVEGVETCLFGVHGGQGDD